MLPASGAVDICLIYTPRHCQCGGKMVKYASMTGRQYTLADKLCIFLATGCGLGLAMPFAPGTFGSLPGVLLAYFFAPAPVFAQIACAILLLAACVPICTKAETLLGIRDDGRIAADEWMLFPIAVLGIPVHTLPWWAMALFFAVTRIVDIVKPPPAYALQRLPAGWGVMLDDFAANLYSLAINWALYLIIFQ